MELREGLSESIGENEQRAMYALSKTPSPTPTPRRFASRITVLFRYIREHPSRIIGGIKREQRVWRFTYVGRENVTPGKKDIPTEIHKRSHEKCIIFTTGTKYIK